jgi:hypothetical protein
MVYGSGGYGGREGGSVEKRRRAAIVGEYEEEKDYC